MQFGGLLRRQPELQEPPALRVALRRMASLPQEEVAFDRDEAHDERLKQNGQRRLDEDASNEQRSRQADHDQGCSAVTPVPKGARCDGKGLILDPSRGQECWKHKGRPMVARNQLRRANESSLLVRNPAKSSRDKRFRQKQKLIAEPPSSAKPVARRFSSGHESSLRFILEP